MSKSRITEEQMWQQLSQFATMPLGHPKIEPHIHPYQDAMHAYAATGADTEGLVKLQEAVEAYAMTAVRKGDGVGKISTEAMEQAEGVKEHPFIQWANKEYSADEASAIKDSLLKSTCIYTQLSMLAADMLEQRLRPKEYAALGASIDSQHVAIKGSLTQFFGFSENDSVNFLTQYQAMIEEGIKHLGLDQKGKMH